MSSLSKELQGAVKKKKIEWRKVLVALRLNILIFDSYLNLNTLISQLCEMAMLSKIHNYKDKVKLSWEGLGKKVLW